MLTAKKQTVPSIVNGDRLLLWGLRNALRVSKLHAKAQAVSQTVKFLSQTRVCGWCSESTGLWHASQDSGSIAYDLCLWCCNYVCWDPAK